MEQLKASAAVENCISALQKNALLTRTLIAGFHVT